MESIWPRPGNKHPLLHASTRSHSRVDFRYPFFISFLVLKKSFIWILFNLKFSAIETLIYKRCVFLMLSGFDFMLWFEKCKKKSSKRDENVKYVFFIFAVSFLILNKSGGCVLYRWVILLIHFYMGSCCSIFFRSEVFVQLFFLFVISNKRCYIKKLACK